MTKVGNYLGTVAAWGVAYWEFFVNNVLQMRVYDQIGYAAQRELITEMVGLPGEQILINGINATALALDMGIGLGWDLEYWD
jgi:hypothetical protein